MKHGMAWKRVKMSLVLVASTKHPHAMDSWREEEQKANAPELKVRKSPFTMMLQRVHCRTR
jgi:hypothetical protein